MVAEGLSTTIIQETLRAAGTSFRRTDFLELVRAVREVDLSRDYLASVPKKFLPNPARLPKPVGTTLRKFSFRVTVRGRGGETGAAIEQHITVSSSANMTRGAVETRALNLFLAQQQLYRAGEEEMEPDTIELETGTATYNPGAP
jgi:hypothetical protein